MACHVSLTWLSMCHHMVGHVSSTWLAMCCSTRVFSKYLKFRLSRNSTKFDWLANFHETIQRCNPFCHPRSRKIPTFLWTIPVNYRFDPFLSENFLNLKFSRVLHSPPLKIISSRNFRKHTHSNTCICNSHLKH